MKKKILSLVLCIAMVASLFSTALAFSDMPNETERSAALSLSMLGIVEGVGGNSFAPTATLTRAQFCKMAVIASGFNEEHIYSGFSLFPDVSPRAWYAPYVNAAVKKYGIINGYPNGTFGPNDTITYGQAVTILIRMLGYTPTDVGMFWPRDYVIKASTIGLNLKMRNFSSDEAVTRGQAAIMIRNMLAMKTKDGGLFINQGFKNVSEGTLIATSSTSYDLMDNEVIIYMGGTAETYRANKKVDAAFVGSLGLCVFDEGGNLDAFVETGEKTTVEVVEATASQIRGKTTTISVPRTTPLLVGGTITTYGAGWPEIKNNSIVHVTRKDGDIKMIVIPDISVDGSNTFVYGVDAFAIPGGAKIIKEGSQISASALSKYDVVSYDDSQNTYYVSSDKISVIYEKGGPIYQSPEWIEAGGTRFSISEKAATYFNGFTINSGITLLFDYKGNVAAAFKTGTISGQMTGIIDRVTRESVEITLTNGVTLMGRPHFSDIGAINDQNVYRLYMQLGRLVNVSQSMAGEVRFSSKDFEKSTGGSLNVNTKTVGSIPLSPDVKIYERVAEGMPLYPISLADIKADTVVTTSILNVSLNTAGEVSLLVVQDVTAKGYVFGIGREITTEDGNRISISTGTGTQEITSQHFTGIGVTDSPIAVAKGVFSQGYVSSVPAYNLERFATIGRGDFASGGRLAITTGGQVSISDNVQVYTESTRRFVDFAEARVNFSAFELYLDRPVSEGGQVVVIIAK